jgi:nitrite reductase/ring-hydroxylating ferredoxin subunit
MSTPPMGPTSPPPRPSLPADGQGPSPSPLPVRLCDSPALEERGLAHGFDLLLWGQPARAFVLRFDGRVVGYVNRCAHVPVEMDWQPGRFLDLERRWIICSIHGAAYEPADGLCVGGPCRGRRLIALQLDEREGGVYWYPSRDLRPAGPPPSAAVAGTSEKP